MLFKKQLKLTPSTSKNYEQGQIDGVKGCADRFTWLSWEMSDMIKTPIIFVFVLYRLTVLMGTSFIPSLTLMVLCIQLDKRIDKIMVPIHKAKGKIDEKLGNDITNTINNIKALKFYAWDSHFEEIIAKKKKESQDYQLKIEAYVCLYICIWVILPWMMNSTAFAVYIGRGMKLELPLAIEIMGLIENVRHPLE